MKRLNLSENARRGLTLALGFIFLGLGVLGTLIPVLPTTPFLLLSAGLFLKSSERLYLWLTRHPVLGNYIHAYTSYKAVSPVSKYVGIAILWLTIGISMWATQRWWLTVILAIVGIGVTIHLAKMRTLTPEMMAELEVWRKAHSGKVRQAKQ